MKPTYRERHLIKLLISQSNLPCRYYEKCPRKGLNDMCIFNNVNEEIDEDEEFKCWSAYLDNNCLNLKDIQEIAEKNYYKVTKLNDNNLFFENNDEKYFNEFRFLDFLNLIRSWGFSLYFSPEFSNYSFIAYKKGEI
jgi:hypothetical protein